MKLLVKLFAVMDALMSHNGHVKTARSFRNASISGELHNFTFQ